MNMLLDANATQELQAQTIAVQMKMKRFGNSKKLDDTCLNDITRTLNADSDRIRATEVIVNSKHPAYKAVVSHMSRIKREFIERTVSYPEPTIRLMHIDRLDAFRSDLAHQVSLLEGLVITLDVHRDELVDDARSKLGRAFKPEYYPFTFDGQFSIEVSYPAIGPDERLQRLNPELYEQQKRRFEAMMQQAIDETTTALASELDTILGSIVQKLAEGKQLRSNMFDPLNSFLDRFQDIRLGSSRAIQEVVDQARAILSNKDPVWVARSASLRTSIAESLAPLHQSVTQFVEEAPYRMMSL